MVFSFLVTSLVGIASGLLASRSVIRINPAEAMRTSPPLSGRHILLEAWPRLWGSLNSSWRMSLRSIFRNRVRFAVTVLGIMSSVVLLVFACFTNDATDFLMNQNFKQVNHYDYQVRFTEPIKYTQILDWNRWNEVQLMEPMLEFSAKIINKGQSEDEMLVGLEPSSRLKRVYDKIGQQRQIPDEGILISNSIAKKLGLEVGDKVVVETTLGMGSSHISELMVVGKNDPMTGTGSYVSLNTANRLLGEQEVVTAVLLKLDKAQMKSFEDRLQGMSRVSSVMSSAREQETFAELLGTMRSSLGIMILFAVLQDWHIRIYILFMTSKSARRGLYLAVGIPGGSGRPITQGELDPSNLRNCFRAPCRQSYRGSLYG